MGQLPSRRELVTTDASQTGWGAVWRRRTVQGRWLPAIAGEHINALELRAVGLALERFLPVLQGRHVLIRSDNRATVFHVNHYGGTRSKNLLRLSQEMWIWAYPKFLSLRAMHLAGVNNVVADTLSRQATNPGHWRLHPQVVRQIWDLFGEARVDLFASADTTHCPLWFSEQEQNSPMGQDALAHSWPDALLYAFPPIPLVRLLLTRTQEDGHRVLLVAPRWPSRTWFPLLLSLVQGTPWKLPVRKDLLSQLGGHFWCPHPEYFRLWLWPLGPVLS